LASEIDLKVYDLEIARQKIQAYCAYQERCHQEVSRKLSSWGLIPEAIDLLVGELMQLNFLNEERFARSFARGKFRIKRWGKIKISIALKRKGIYAKCIALAMEEIDDTAYLEALRTVLESKNQTLKEKNPYQRKLKLTRYLLSRGYEHVLILDALAEME
jgi:regulatory protein